MLLTDGELDILIDSKINVLDEDGYFLEVE